MNKAQKRISPDRLIDILVAFVLSTFLFLSVNGSVVCAQSSDRKPGDPIDLGHVHKSYSAADDSSAASTPAASPLPGTTFGSIQNQATIPGGDQASTASSAIRKGGFLQGTVEHSEQMAPVQGLSVGTRFDDARFHNLGPSTRTWYRVPPWMAGTWNSVEQTQTFRQDFRKGTIDTKPLVGKTSINSVTRGSQRDRLGGIWDCLVLPRTNEVVSEKWISKALFNEESVIFDSDAKLIVRYVITKTNVEKATNTIGSVDQVEQFNTYSPGGPDRVRIETSSKIFDRSGHPTELTRGWMFALRVSPFTLNNYDRNNQDVRSSFRDYLKNTDGLQNLVPTEP